MNTGKCSVYALILVLTFSSVLFGQCISAQIDANVAAQKAQIAIQFLCELNDTSTEHLNRLYRIGDAKLASQANHTYQLGNTLFQAAITSWREHNFETAISAVYEAMTAFQNVLKLSEAASPNSAESYLSAEKIISLKANVTRAFAYLEEVGNLAKNAGDAGFNVSLLNNLINETRILLQEAHSQMSVDFSTASARFRSADFLINKIIVKVTELSAKWREIRSETYIAAAEQRIVTLRTNITSPVSAVPVAVKSASIVALDQAESSLTTARNNLDEGKTEEAISALETSRMQEQQSIKILQDAGVPIPSGVTSNSNTTSAIKSPNSTTSNSSNSTNVGGSRATAPTSRTNSDLTGGSSSSQGSTP
jgi:hypothetical protein